MISGAHLYFESFFERVEHAFSGYVVVYFWLFAAVGLHPPLRNSMPAHFNGAVTLHASGLLVPCLVKYDELFRTMSQIPSLFLLNFRSLFSNPTTCRLSNLR